MNTPETRPFPGRGRRRIAFWVALLLLGVQSACTGAAPPPAPSPQVTLPPEAYVTFEVTIPANTPAQEGVSLVVLDEVTGLALNPARYPMEAQDATHYRVEVAFPLNTMVKYRYEREGEIALPEHNTDNRQVRYRLFRVLGPATVQDSVSRWVDTPFEGQTGRLQGRLIEAESGAPLPGILLTCAGRQTYTAADGSYTLEGLPVGTHWLVAYAPNGRHEPFQQQVEIAPQATTPAILTLAKRPLVNVTFVVSPPADMPPLLPMRLAGNLSTLGNTYADLEGGISTPALRLPRLSARPDGRHTLSLQLPSGAEVRYKYTLGDGYWNAEHTAAGDFRVRRLLVPDHDVEIEDRVETWYDGEHPYLTFDVRVPPETPPEEMVAVQLSSFGWMEPFPMWEVEANHWTYFIFSPLEGITDLHYRYCRNAQCGLADAADTAGERHQGHTLDLRAANTPGPEVVAAWQWWEGEPAEKTPPFGTTPRPAGFAAGVAFPPAYAPSWQALYPQALERARGMHANTVIFSPAWHFTRNQPAVLEPVSGVDASWEDWRDLSFQAMRRGLQVALYPQPQAALSSEAWWQAAPQDAAWRKGWFEMYRRFALHHALLAESIGAQSLILGGPWVTPALPEAESAPPDAEAHWRALLDEIRLYYHGELRWALPYRPGDLS
ncbi:MAG TPA: carboxypeptidase regulatory-like domain-containing protein, partial [Chloroflexi bacterium]|nr:carboxypeptidase regulatory-like domain-containing protein [Chloroflexota bacterium]